MACGLWHAAATHENPPHSRTPRTMSADDPGRHQSNISQQTADYRGTFDLQHEDPACTTCAAMLHEGEESWCFGAFPICGATRGWAW